MELSPGFSIFSTTKLNNFNLPWWLHKSPRIYKYIKHNTNTFQLFRKLSFRYETSVSYVIIKKELKPFLREIPLKPQVSSSKKLVP